VKHEKYHNPVTGQDEDADEDLMAEVEHALHVETGRWGSRGLPARDHRQDWCLVLDHRDQRPDYERIFPRPPG